MISFKYFFVNTKSNVISKSNKLKFYILRFFSTSNSFILLFSLFFNISSVKNKILNLYI
jgi:hypothetical protein